MNTLGKHEPIKILPPYKFLQIFKTKMQAILACTSTSKIPLCVYPVPNVQWESKSLTQLSCL